MRSSNTPVITQKGESQNGCFKKTKAAKFSEKRTFFTPLIRTRRNTRFDICRFALLPTNTKVYSIRQYIKKLYGLFMDGVQLPQG